MWSTEHRITAPKTLFILNRYAFGVYLLMNTVGTNLSLSGSDNLYVVLFAGSPIFSAVHDYFTISCIILNILSAVSNVSSVVTTNGEFID